LWISIGYGTLSLFFSTLVEHVGSFTPAWTGFCVLSLVELILVGVTDWSPLLDASKDKATGELLASPTDSEGATENGSSKQRRTAPAAMSRWSDLFLEPRYVLFLFVTLSFGACSAAFESLLTVFISTLTKNAAFVGASLIIQCASELVPFYYSHVLIEKAGPHLMVCCSMAAFVLRCVLTSLVTNPYWLMPIQLLHGLTMAIFLTAGVELSHRNAPSRALQASAQGLFQLAYTSAGGAGGNVFGGWLFEKAGGAAMYGVNGSITAVVLVVWVVTGALTCPKEGRTGTSGEERRLLAQAGTGRG